MLEPMGGLSAGQDLKAENRKHRMAVTTMQITRSYYVRAGKRRMPHVKMRTRRFLSCMQKVALPASQRYGPRKLVVGRAFHFVM